MHVVMSYMKHTVHILSYHQVISCHNNLPCYVYYWTGFCPHCTGKGLPNQQTPQEIAVAQAAAEQMAGDSMLPAKVTLHRAGDTYNPEMTAYFEASQL